MLSDMPYGNTSTLSAMLNWQAEEIDEVRYEKTNKYTTSTLCDMGKLRCYTIC